MLDPLGVDQYRFIPIAEREAGALIYILLHCFVHSFHYLFCIKNQWNLVGICSYGPVVRYEISDETSKHIILMRDNTHLLCKPPFTNLWRCWEQYDICGYFPKTKERWTIIFWMNLENLFFASRSSTLVTFFATKMLFKVIYK